MKQKRVYQPARMQSIELSSLSSLLAASDAASNPTNVTSGARFSGTLTEEDF